LVRSQFASLLRILRFGDGFFARFLRGLFDDFDIDRHLSTVAGFAYVVPDSYSLMIRSLEYPPIRHFAGVKKHIGTVIVWSDEAETSIFVPEFKRACLFSHVSVPPFADCECSRDTWHIERATGAT
jgi:hypothetical protein